MIIDPITTETKLQTYIRAAKKQQQYVDRFTPIYCTDTIFNYYDSNYTGLNTSCYSTFDPRVDPLYAEDLTREELDALTDQDYFDDEQLRYYFDLLVREYCLSDKNYDIKDQVKQRKKNNKSN